MLQVLINATPRLDESHRVVGVLAVGQVGWMLI